MTETVNERMIAIRQHHDGITPQAEPVPAETSGVLQKYVKSLDTHGLPVHLYMVQQLGMNNPVETMRTLSRYTGEEAVDITKHMNKAVNICGAAIIEHPPFEGMDGNFHGDGYCYVVLKTDLYTTRDVIVGKKVVKQKSRVMLRTSANQICDLVLGLVSMMGWFDWDQPVQMVFTKSGKSYLATIPDYEVEEEDTATKSRTKVTIADPSVVEEDEDEVLEEE